MNKSIIAGIFGSVIGIVLTIVGILWILQYNIVLSEYQSAVNLQNIFFFIGDIVGTRIFILYFFQNLSVSNAITSFTGITGLLVILLIPTLILLGVGLYGLGKIEGKAMGIVSLIFGIIGAVLATILLLEGAASGGTTITAASLWIMMNSGPLFLFGTTPPLIKFVFLIDMLGVPTVNTGLLWLGLLVLGITITIFGATFILVREGLESPGLSVATGVLFILAGIFLFLGVLLPWLSFIFLFVALIMAALVFFGSREMG
ncbi:MAG: hypothetical protein QXO71_01740 [Candidatus Jordarchaeaceae archaeon]